MNKAGYYLKSDPSQGAFGPFDDAAAANLAAVDAGHAVAGEERETISVCRWQLVERSLAQLGHHADGEPFAQGVEWTHLGRVDDEGLGDARDFTPRETEATPHQRSLEVPDQPPPSSERKRMISRAPAPAEADPPST